MKFIKLFDKELRNKLREISKSREDSENPYDSIQGAIAFARYRNQLKKDNTSIPYKEAKLLEKILQNESVKDYLLSRKVKGLDVPKGDERVNLIDIGVGNGDNLKILIKNMTFPLIRCYPVDISPYFGAIAWKNLKNEFPNGFHKVANSKKIKPDKEEEPQAYFFDYHLGGSFERFKIETHEEKRERLERCISKYHTVICMADDVISEKEFITYKYFNVFIQRKMSGVPREKLASHLKETFHKDMSPQIKEYIKKYEKMDLKGQDSIDYFIDRYFEMEDLCTDDLTSEEIDHMKRTGMYMEPSLKENMNYIFETGRNNVKKLETLLKNDDLTHIERFFDTYENVLDYFERYFDFLEGKLKLRKFHTIAKSAPSFHAEIFKRTFLIDFDNVDNIGDMWNTVSTDEQKNAVTRLMIEGCLLTPNQSEEFSASRLATEISSSVDNYLINPSLSYCLNKNDKVVAYPFDSITLNFMDFEEVSQSIDYFTCFAKGVNTYMFLGQTLGNYDAKGRQDLLNKFHSEMKQGDLLFIGVDLRPSDELSEGARAKRVKDMEREYRKGETFARLCAPDISAKCKYVPKYDEETHRMDINFEVDGDLKTVFNSYKFEPGELEKMLALSGFNLIGREYFVPNEGSPEYAVYLCEKPKPRGWIKKVASTLPLLGGFF